MAVTAVSGVEARRPNPRLRKLEDERWLALTLLMPTAILLGLFIAYPFFEGVLLSFTNQRVGVPGEFVGLQDCIGWEVRRPVGQAAFGANGIVRRFVNRTQQRYQ